MSVHRISIVKTVQSYNFSPIYPSSCRKNFPRPCILSDSQVVDTVSSHAATRDCRDKAVPAPRVPAHG